MRLIDADAFERSVMCSDAEDMQDVIYALRDYPTAYDPDKVVEQLEEAEHNAHTMIGFEKTYGSVDDRIKAEAEERALKYAIEIVKGGGVK